jgi:drug/metabolite transporter (DMT)-like permease
MTQVTQKHLSLGGWGLMALLALIWGGSFSANHAALSAVPVAATVATRVGGAALVLWIFIALARLPVPRRFSFVVTSLVLGFGNNVVPFTLIVWGQTHVPSGLAGILNATTALFQVLVAAAVFPDERLTPNRLIGVLVGLAGVAAIIGPSALAHLDPTSLGQLAILGAGLAYALSAAYGRKRLAGIRPEVGAAGMLSGASLIMIPAALLLDGTPAALPPLPALAGLAYLALVSSAYAYRLYYTVLAQAGAGNLGLVTLLIAPIAVLLGWAILGETLPASAFAGLALLTLGMILVDGRLTARFFRAPAA